MGQQVPNAAILLQNSLLQTDIGPFYTDTNGFVTVTNLQEGDWDWQVSAAGCSVQLGKCTVVAGQTIYAHARMNRSLVTVNFSVAPVAFTDLYELKVEQVFETYVPLPVLVLSPALTTFENVTPGFEATYIVTAQNQGLIEMENLTVASQHIGSATLTPLVTYAPRLLPQQIIDIPFRVTYSGTSVPSHQDDSTGGTTLSSASTASGRCSKDGALVILGAVVLLILLIVSSPEIAASAFVLKTLELIIIAFWGVAGFDLIALPLFKYGLQQVEHIFSESSAAPQLQLNGCFTADTKVLMADGRLKAISDVQAGDFARSGPAVEDQARVSGVYCLSSQRVRQITLFGGRDAPLQSLRVTDEHLIWVDGKGWVTAGRIKPGDWLFTSGGRRLQVADNSKLAGETNVFTLRLSGESAFYANGILVHDLCGSTAPTAKIETPKGNK